MATWDLLMEVHLVDGTYELFSYYHALPSAIDEGGQEVAAVRGVLHSMLALIREGATHIGVATDHVIESFRNQLWPGYKTAEGIEPELLAQFPLLEEALTALGIVVWPMVEYEADDALASAVNAAASMKVLRGLSRTANALNDDRGDCIPLSSGVHECGMQQNLSPARGDYPI